MDTLSANWTINWKLISCLNNGIAFPIKYPHCAKSPMSEYKAFRNLILSD